MPLSKAFLIAIFLLILIKQFFSLSQSGPTISSSVEAVATTAVILLFFSGFRGKAYMMKICAFIGIAIGLLYILPNMYLYLEGQKIIYVSSVVGLIQVMMGTTIIFRHPYAAQNDVEISYFMSLIPIGYIALLTIHNPYPIEANISLFIIQLIVVALTLSTTQNTSKRHKNILTGSMIIISLIFFAYFIIGFINKSNMYSIEYLAYGLLVVSIALKVAPYHVADSK
ncbi:MAG: hypothetical protein AB7D39_16350 [Pseudodesulfovibrio sp.]|uniref:hypothetical protein n=1 Tax=Pseudodesulfovibrio sp. TaxID=2035812 RepID=UPI003D0F1E0B